MDSSRLDSHSGNAGEAGSAAGLGDSGAGRILRDAHSIAGRRTQLNQAVNGRGAAAVAMPRAGTLSDLVGSDQYYERKHGLVARGAKRAFDIVCSLLLIAILAPVWLTIAILIKADSPGPVLFRQRRIGRNGQPFQMIKFRTMVDGADAYKPALLHLNDAAEGLFKIYGDPRITKVGRSLRSTSLDELPQLIHVVTGKMSLVGPRPLVPEEDAQIAGSQRRRLQMRPGMTGIWQVGGASAIPIHQMARLDSGYVDNWSLWADVKLLVSTAAHVVSRKGL
jgi:lipopolysaccharide/colanic/teichoic acid biosynthesis glycosyltransferase